MSIKDANVLYDQVADALASTGYIVIDAALPAFLLDNLINHLHQQSQELKAASVGRGQNAQQNLQIRGDAIQWLSNTVSVESEFLQWMDQLRMGLNQRLYSGLVDYEGHFAVYPVGAFYQKHLDSFRNGPDEHHQSLKGKPTRKISNVLYLNTDWKADDGGELLLYDESGDEIIESIAPEYGRLVIFLSEKFPHEVKVATRDRRSIAGWFRSR